MIHAFGLGDGNPQGLNIGARCHSLHLDATSPFILTTRKAANTTTAYSGANQILIPWDKTWMGLRFHVQGAWADSKTSLFSLTRARNFVVPGYPTGTLKKRLLFHYVLTTSNGIGPYTTWAGLTLPRITFR